MTLSTFDLRCFPPFFPSAFLTTIIRKLFLATEGNLLYRKTQRGLLLVSHKTKNLMLLAAKTDGTEQTLQNDTKNVKIQQKLYQKRDTMPSKLPVEKKIKKTLKKENLHLNSGILSIFNKLIRNNGLPLYVYR